MKHYVHIAARVFNMPLLILPSKLDAIIAGLGGRLLGAELAMSAPQAFTTAEGERKQPGYRIIDGVGVLDIFGILAHRGGLTAESTYLLGYQDIARQFDAAVADPDVGAILLNLDSPGGEVAGAFDLAEQIRRAQSIKPVRAVAADLAASAAYLIGSAAEQFAVTRTGYAGSIGIVMRHVDFSQALASEGIRVTHIFAGGHKVDGNPYEPLPDAVRGDFQREIDGLYAMFVDAVALHRGLEAAAVRATEAAVLRGEEAVAARLADRIATPDQMIAEMADMVRRAKPMRGARAQSERRIAMQDHDTSAGSESSATYTQADLDRARAEGHATGVTAGRALAAAIIGHVEAAGRQQLATRLARMDNMTLEQAAELLAVAPKDQPAAQQGNGFTAAMAALPNPQVGADKPAADDDLTEAQAVLAAFNRTK